MKYVIVISIHVFLSIKNVCFNTEIPRVVYKSPPIRSSPRDFMRDFLESRLNMVELIFYLILH